MHMRLGRVMSYCSSFYVAYGSMKVSVEIHQRLNAAPRGLILSVVDVRSRSAWHAQNTAH